MAYEAVDKIRTFKTQIKDIFGDYKDHCALSIKKLREEITNVQTKIKEIEKSFIEFHYQLSAKATSIIEAIEKETLKDLQDARAKKWN